MSYSDTRRATARGTTSAAPRRGPATDHRPSYLAAAIVSTAVLILYIITLAPSTAMWDASEYIAAAHVLGIPHPPGNPLFVLLGRFFAILPIAPNVAMRINILAALSSAVAAGMWFLITERVLASWLAERWQRIAGATAAAIIGATAFTVWNQSVVNEKVYTVSLVILAIVSWLMVRWCDDPDGPVADRLLLLVAFLTGLGYANHPAGFLVLPAVGMAVLMRRPGTLLRGRLIVASAGMVLLGLTPFAMQPIRAAHFPPMNMGEVSGCVTEISADCILSSTTMTRWRAHVTREQYGKPSLLMRQAPLSAQFGMYWMYFEWQWLRDAYGERPGLQRVLALLFLGLGLAGGWVHYKRDRQSFWFFGPLVATVTVALVYYMNFKYGFSQALHLGESVPREVRDRDYFYLWSFSTWSVWAALGLTLVWSTVAGLFMPNGGEAGNGSSAATLAAGRKAGGGREASRGTEAGPTSRTAPGASPGTSPDTSPEKAAARRRPWIMAAPVLAIALIPLFTNWSQASRSGEWATREWAHDLLNSVEPYGIIITVGDNDTFPLWYAQEVEGIRQDVTVAVTSLLNTDWYVRTLIRRPIHVYDAAAGPAVYRDREWPVPTGPAVRMSMAEADALPPYSVLPGPVTFTHEGITAVIDPRRLAQGVLEKADAVVLRMLQANRGERSVYISRTAGGYGESLGLGNYLLTQGFASKIMLREITEDLPDVVRVQGGGWLDVPRTRTLWDDVFRGHDALIAQDRWIDHASRGIALVYVATGLMLSEALAAQGETEASDQVMAKALAVADAARLR